MPRKPPPRPDPLSPHGVRMTIIGKLVSQASLRQKGAWGRELHLLKRLQAQLGDEAFWLQLSPAMPLESLAYFQTEYGKASLREQWDLYQFAQAEEARAAQSQLDSASIRATLEATGGEDVPALKPRKTAIAWADGEGG